jgi:hypothetical protein
MLLPILNAGVKLRGTLDVRRILQQFLNPHQNLFNRNGTLPVLLLIQNAQTHGSRRVNIRVRQQRLELT